MSTRLSSVLSSSGNYYPRSKHCSSCSILRFDFRLQYYNLKNSRSQNALALEEVQGLWIPFLVFDNTENNEATRGTEDTEVTITRSASLSYLLLCSSLRCQKRPLRLLQKVLHCLLRQQC